MKIFHFSRVDFETGVPRLKVPTGSTSADLYLSQLDWDGKGAVPGVFAGRLARVAPETHVIRPEPDVVTVFVTGDCGYRGSFEFEPKTLPDGTFLFEEFHSPRGSLGVDQIAAFSLPVGHFPVVLRAYITGRRVGVPVEEAQVVVRIEDGKPVAEVRKAPPVEVRNALGIKLAEALGIK